MAAQQAHRAAHEHEHGGVRDVSAVRGGPELLRDGRERRTGVRRHRGLHLLLRHDLQVGLPLAQVHLQRVDQPELRDAHGDEGVRDGAGAALSLHGLVRDAIHDELHRAGAVQHRRERSRPHRLRAVRRGDADRPHRQREGLRGGLVRAGRHHRLRHAGQRGHGVRLLDREGRRRPLRDLRPRVAPADDLLPARQHDGRGELPGEDGAGRRRCPRRVRRGGRLDPCLRRGGPVHHGAELARRPRDLHGGLARVGPRLRGMVPRGRDARAGLVRGRRRLHERVPRLPQGHHGRPPPLREVLLEGRGLLQGPGRTRRRSARERHGLRERRRPREPRRAGRHHRRGLRYRGDDQRLLPGVVSRREPELHHRHPAPVRPERLVRRR